MSSNCESAPRHLYISRRSHNANQATQRRRELRAGAAPSHAARCTAGASSSGSNSAVRSCAAPQAPPASQPLAPRAPRVAQLSRHRLQHHLLKPCRHITQAARPGMREHNSSGASSSSSACARKRVTCFCSATASCSSVAGGACMHASHMSAASAACSPDNTAAAPTCRQQQLPVELRGHLPGRVGGTAWPPAFPDWEHQRHELACGGPGTQHGESASGRARQPHPAGAAAAAAAAAPRCRRRRQQRRQRRLAARC